MKNNKEEFERVKVKFKMSVYADDNSSIDTNELNFNFNVIENFISKVRNETAEYVISKMSKECFFYCL